MKNLTIREEIKNAFDRAKFEDLKGWTYIIIDRMKETGKIEIFGSNNAQGYWQSDKLLWDGFNRWENFGGDDEEDTEEWGWMDTLWQEINEKLLNNDYLGDEELEEMFKK